MKLSSLPNGVVATAFALLFGAAFFAFAGDALAAASAAPSLPQIGSNAQDMVLGFLSGIFSVILAIAALRHTGDRNVGLAMWSLVFLLVAGYFILVPEGGKQLIESTGKQLLSGHAK